MNEMEWIHETSSCMVLLIFWIGKIVVVHATFRIIIIFGIELHQSYVCENMLSSIRYLYVSQDNTIHDPHPPPPPPSR